MRPPTLHTRRLLSIYVGGNTFVDTNSPEDGIRRALAAGGAGGQVVGTHLGCSNNTNGTAQGRPWLDRNVLGCTNNTLFPEAVALAQSADVVVLFVGLSPGIDGGDGESGESEGTDRPNDLNFPGFQPELIQQVAAANPNVVLVAVHGSASLSMESEKGLVPAILDAHYPGQNGGDAIASVLFGDVSPSGRPVRKSPLATKNLLEDTDGLRRPP